MRIPSTGHRHVLHPHRHEIRTRALVAISASVALLGLTGVAQAEGLISPPLPTTTGSQGACDIRNTGTIAVTVQVSPFSNNGLSVSFSNCDDGPLAGGCTCVVRVNDLPDDSCGDSRDRGEVARNLRGP